ncbi:MAG: hypothetical protein Q9227_006261 [Pyrenula ochraceoflavens]
MEIMANFKESGPYTCPSPRARKEFEKRIREVFADPNRDYGRIYVQKTIETWEARKRKLEKLTTPQLEEWLKLRDIRVGEQNRSRILGRAKAVLAGTYQPLVWLHTPRTIETADISTEEDLKRAPYPQLVDWIKQKGMTPGRSNRGQLIERGKIVMREGFQDAFAKTKIRRTISISEVKRGDVVKRLTARELRQYFCKHHISHGLAFRITFNLVTKFSRP